MNKLFLMVALLFSGSSLAAGNSAFYINPENPYQGSNVDVGIALYLSCGIPLLVEHDGSLKKNIIVDGNKIKLLTYLDSGFICIPSPVPPGVLIYELGILNLPVGNYTLELYFLPENTPSPLPVNYPLTLEASVDFQMLQPILVGSSSVLSLSLLMIGLFLVGFIKLKKIINI